MTLRRREKMPDLAATAQAQHSLEEDRAKALAERPPVDKNGVHLEVGQVIRYSTVTYAEERVARVAGVNPEWEWGYDRKQTADRDSDRDKLDVKFWNRVPYGVGIAETSHGCHAHEAEVIPDRETIWQWEEDQIDLQLAQVEAQEAKLTQRRREIERERERLRRCREAQR